jgi:hypothetical protein
VLLRPPAVGVEAAEYLAGEVAARDDRLAGPAAVQKVKAVVGCERRIGVGTELPVRRSELGRGVEGVA